MSKLNKLDYPVPPVFPKFNIPERLLFSAGPSNYAPRVQKAIGAHNLGCFHPEILECLDNVKDGLKYLFQTENPMTFAVSTSGNGAMDAALSNLIEKDDVVLVANTGVWSERAIDMAQRYGADVKVLQAKLQLTISLEEIKAAMEEHNPAIFFMVHGDSSSGTIQKLEGIGELCIKHNCISIIDTVITLGALEVNVDRNKIDVAFSSPQKVLNGPQGLAPITVNQRAMNKINSRKTKPPVFYFDFNLITQYWNCLPNLPRIYHHTISGALLYGLREAIAIVCEEGLEAVIEKHSQMSQRFQRGIHGADLEMFVNKQEDRCPTVNLVKIPEGLDELEAINYAMAKYDIEIGFGFWGPTIGKVFRIGLMGVMATPERVDLVVKVLAESIEYAKTKPRIVSNGVKKNGTTPTLPYATKKNGVH